MMVQQPLGMRRQRPAILLAQASEADFDAVALLFAALHCFNAALDPCFALAAGWRALLHEHFMRTHTSDGALWLLAWDGSNPVGVLLLEAHHDSPLFEHRHWAELVALYVAPHCRGHGLAERLVGEARRWATAHGFDRIQLYVTATNERARGFYHKHGFAPVQEIWRLEVETAPGAVQPDDPSCTVVAHCGADLLEHGHHHVAMEIEAHNASKQDH